MKLLKSTTLVIALFLGFACQSENTKAKLQAVTILQGKVDSSSVVFKTIQFETISENKKNAESQLDYLTKNYHDTNMQNARYVDVYNTNFKLMRKLIKGHKRLEKEIDFSNNQLKHLYSDIENGFAQDTNYIKFMQGEELAVSKIVNSTKTLKNWEERTTNRYNGMVAPIDSIILELRNQGFR